jgi:hypothetical protein
LTEWRLIWKKAQISVYTPVLPPNIRVISPCGFTQLMLSTFFDTGSVSKHNTQGIFYVIFIVRGADRQAIASGRVVFGKAFQ